MIIKCGSGAMVIGCSTSFSLRPMCFASTVNDNTHQLRQQLDHLHAEAERTRAKANGARLRLLRLSESAENLRRQAAIKVQNGKENDARELLFQKKKVMQALEKSKTRIELLDQLTAKLNEAISVKETQLIGSVASDHEVNRDADSSEVHFISPKQEFSEHRNESKDDPEISNDQSLHLNTVGLASSIMDGGLEDLQGPLGVESINGDKINSSVRGLSSYEDFLKHLNQELDNIESELVTVLNVSALVLDHDENPKNLKVQQIMELLESIRGLRQRISSFIHVDAS